MIRCYMATYMKFEDETRKRKDHYIVFEIMNRDLDSIPIIIGNEQHLILATEISSMTEIKGYHRYVPNNSRLSPFGVGGLTPLNTKDKNGMLESLAAQSRIPYTTLATIFGRGLLASKDDYIQLMDS